MADSTKRATPQRDQQQRVSPRADEDAGARVGKFGGDDGALEHERAKGGRPEAGTPRASSDPAQAQRQQDRDLETGEENPG